jgi:TonB family protein
MLLKLVDRLVKEGNYAEALRILARASEEDPKNPYVRAYEARIRVLMDLPPPPATDRKETGPPRSAPSRTSPPASSAMSPDQRRVALLSKVAAILSKATEYLSAGEFQRAIEEVGRARLLDAENPDIKTLEQRIREAQHDAEQFAEAERARAAREQEEANRRELEDLRREEERRRSEEERARRAAHEQKLNESLARGRALLEAGRLKEAQNEMAFALVLDPNNSAARHLEQEISRAQQQALRAELQRRKQEEEERARAAEELRTKIRDAAEQAQALAERGEFAGALEAITRAYVLDPTSDILQAAEAKITAARDEAVRHEREAQLARQREEQQRQLDDLRRKATDQREALLRRREAEEETRRQATRQEIDRHLERARDFLARSQFEAALSEVALGFVADPFSEPTRALEQEILRARDAAPPLHEETEPDPALQDDPPHAITVHLDSAREHAAARDFARSFDAIARAYAVDPLHPAVQECERIVQAAFVDYQASLTRTAGPRRPGEGTLSPSGRSTLSGVLRGEAVSTAVLTFDDTTLAGAVAGAPAEAPPPEPDAQPAWYRHRTVMYGGGLGTLVVVAAVFLISSPSGKKPEAADPAPHLQPAEEQIHVQEPQSAPVTLSEPRILPVDQQAAAEAKKMPGKLRREETAPDDTRNAAGSGNTESAAPAESLSQASDEGAADGQPATSGEGTPPVSLTKLEVSSSALAGAQRQSVSAPVPAQTPKAPEIKRLQQPRIPDAVLRSGITGEVAVLVEINGEGTPVSARVTRSTIPVLNDLFIEAVMASEFVPGVSADGRTTTYLTIPFRVGG